MVKLFKNQNITEKRNGLHGLLENLNILTVQLHLQKTLLI